MSSAVAARRGSFSNGLVATSGGMAPSSSHPGLRQSQKPTFQLSSRERVPTDDARENKAVHLTDFHSGGAATGKGGGKRSKYDSRPVGRRHLDPHHFTNLSDEAKRQEGRLGRAHVNGPHNALTLRTLGSRAGDPAAGGGAAPSGGHRPHSHNFDTSAQLAEGKLRRIANGRDGGEGDPAKQEEYQTAARAMLQQYRGDPAIVEQERVLAHRIASDAYANESAQRLAATEDSLRRRYANRQEGGCSEGAAGALGSPALALQSSTPFALDGSAPRGDTNTSVTGYHGIRILKSHNVDHFPLSTAPSASDGGEAAAAAAAALHRPNARRYESRGMQGGRPFDDIISSGDRYPSPPPVGVSVGIYQKPMMVRPAPGYHGGARTRGEDRDTLALKRARAQASCARGNAEGSQSMDRPEYFAPRTEASQVHPPQQQQHRRAPATLRERTEARWHREAAEREGRRTGRACVAAHNRHTALW